MGDTEKTDKKQPQSALGTGVLKTPPVMSDKMTYDEWKTEIELWSTITDAPKSKQGGLLFFTLQGDARDTIRSKLEMKQISADDGLQNIIKTLDELYLKDSNQRSFAAYEDFINFRRETRMPIKDFIIQFNIKYNRIKSHNMALPEGELAYNLLVSANLSTDQQQLCRATASTMTYEGMKNAIEKVAVSHTTEEKFQPSYLTSNDNQRYDQCQARKKYERQNCDDLSTSNSHEETFYTTHNMKQNYRGASYKNRTQNAIPNRKDEFGRPTTCSFCHSIYHWINDCPHVTHEERERSFRGRMQCRGNSRGGRGGFRGGKHL